MRIQKIVIVASILMTLMCAGRTLASAQSTPETDENASPSFAILPDMPNDRGFAELSVEPAQTVTIGFRVVTIDSIPVTLRVYRTNALSLINGGFGAAADTEEVTDPATWLTLESQTFDLGANEQVHIDATLQVPSDAAPGQYPIAVIAQTEQPIGSSGSSLATIVRSATPMLITVPGPIEAGFSIGEPSVDMTTGAKPLISIPIENTGNILVKPAGTITLTAPSGEIVSTTPISMGAVFGGSTTTIVIPLPEQTPDGTYSIAGTLTDPSSNVSAAIPATDLTLTKEAAAADATLLVGPITIDAVGSPVQFANVTVGMTNNGDTIATANVVLRVTRDQEPVEDYPLARGQALPSGITEVSQRYVPVSGWESGTWEFSVIVQSVFGGAETTLATAAATGSITIA